MKLQHCPPKRSLVCNDAYEDRPHGTGRRQAPRPSPPHQPFTPSPRRATRYAAGAGGPMRRRSRHQQWALPERREPPVAQHATAVGSRPSAGPQQSARHRLVPRGGAPAPATPSPKPPSPPGPPRRSGTRVGHLAVQHLAQRLVQVAGRRPPPQRPHCSHRRCASRRRTRRAFARKKATPSQSGGALLAKHARVLEPPLRGRPMLSRDDQRARSRGT